MTTKNDKPGRTENALLAIRKGAETVLAGGKTFPYLGKTYDLAGFQQLVDTFLTLFTNAREQHTLLATAVSTREANDPAAKEFVRLCEYSAASTYGESSLEFSQMGFKPRKKAAELTPEQKQLKLERTRATRAARNVMGSRQKRNVKGVVNPNGGNTGTPVPPVGNTTAPGSGGSNATKP